MKLLRLVAVASVFMSSGVFADTYNCGLFINDEQTPAATASLNDATQTQVVLASANYYGVLQVDTQSSGEKQLVVGVVGKADNMTAITAVPMAFARPVIVLSRSSTDKSTMYCEKNTVELGAPASLHL